MFLCHSASKAQNNSEMPRGTIVNIIFIVLPCLKLKVQDVNAAKGCKGAAPWSGTELWEAGLNPGSASEKPTSSSSMRERR